MKRASLALVPRSPAQRKDLTRPAAPNPPCRTCAAAAPLPSTAAAVAVLIIAFFNALFYTLNERSLFRRLGRCGSGTGDFTGGSGSGRAARRRCAPLLISNRRAGLPPGARPAGSWGWDILDPSHLYTPSFCRGRTPSACAGGCAAPASADGGGYCGGGGGGAVLALAAFRSLHVVVFVFAVAYGEAAYQGGGARGFFIYFTNWSE